MDAIHNRAVMAGGYLVEEMKKQRGGNNTLPIQYFGANHPGPHSSDGSGLNESMNPDGGLGLARPPLESYEAYGGNHGRKWISQAELARCIDMRGLSPAARRRVTQMVNHHMDFVVKRAGELVKNKKRIMGKSHINRADKEIRGGATA